MKTKAPKKLSKAILMALDDQLKAEKNPKLKIDMDQWHLSEGDVCLVCFAGASMHYQCKAPLGLSFDFDYFEISWRSVFKALNCARNGEIGMALCFFDRPFDSKWDIDVVEYSADRPKFRRQMRNLAKRLAKAGL